MSNTVQLIDNNGSVVLTGSSIQLASLAVNNLSLNGVDVAGWVIKASAGLYIEHVILTNGVTLQGANAGIDGTDEARGPETVITGGVEVRGDGATVDGVKILGSFDTARRRRRSPSMATSASRSWAPARPSRTRCSRWRMETAGSSAPSSPPRLFSLPALFRRA